MYGIYTFHVYVRFCCWYSTRALMFASQKSAIENLSKHMLCQRRKKNRMKKNAIHFGILVDCSTLIHIRSNIHVPFLCFHLLYPFFVCHFCTMTICLENSDSLSSVVKHVFRIPIHTIYIHVNNACVYERVCSIRIACIYMNESVRPTDQPTGSVWLSLRIPPCV